MSLEDQLNVPSYSNWVKGTLGLKYLKQGLIGTAEIIVKKQHENLLQNLPNIADSCKQCTLDNLVPFHEDKNQECPSTRSCLCRHSKGKKDRRPCPNKEFCSCFFDMIILQHRYRSPQWKNTEPSKWKADPWSIATCFINTLGYKGKKGAIEIDASGLLSIIIDDLEFGNEIKGITINGENDKFKQARDARNDILHSAEMEISDTDLHSYINLFKEILETEPFDKEKGAQDAMENLDKLQGDTREITSEEEREAHHMKLQEAKLLKIGMIGNIVQNLIDKENQGRPIFVECCDTLLRHHLLMKHACPETVIAVFKREVAKCGISLDNILLSQKEDIQRQLEEDDFKILLPADGTVNASLDKMDVSLICRLLLSVCVHNKNDQERSTSLTSDEIDAINYILEQTKELKCQQSSIQMDRITAKQKCKRIQDALLVLLEKTGECKEDSKKTFHCKRRILRYFYKLKNVDILRCLLNEDVDEIDGCFLNELTKTMLKDQPNKENKEQVQETQKLTFELLLALTRSKTGGKPLKAPEVVEGQICINCASDTILREANLAVLECTMEIIQEKNLSEAEIENQRDHTHTAFYSKLKFVVSNVLSFLVGIAGVKICEALRGSTRLQIECQTCEAIYEVLALISGPRFQDALFEIQTCLEQETKETFEVSGNVSTENLQTVKEHLIEQKVIEAVEEEVTCQLHPGETIDTYCPKHAHFCCETCLDSEHRMCIGQLKEFKVNTLTVSEDKMYNAKTKDDTNKCWIRGSVVLENGDMLLADYQNSKLKKMNSSFLMTCYCNLPEKPSDVCYIGEGIAVVSLLNSTIQFVNIKEELKLVQEVKLDHPCNGLFYLDSVLYVTDDKSVYLYNKDSTEKKLLFRDTSGEVCFRKIAVSDDGERIYVTNFKGSLVTIDKQGSLISTLRNKERLKQPEDVCTSDKDSVLVCCSGSEFVVRVDYNGKRILNIEVKDTDGLHDPLSLSAHRQKSKVIVAEYERDDILVFPLTK